VPALLTSHQSHILPVKAKLENNPTGMAKENAPSLPIISRIPNLNMVTLFIVDNKNTPLISKLVLVCICTDHLPMHTGVRTQERIALFVWCQITPDGSYSHGKARCRRGKDTAKVMRSGYGVKMKRAFVDVGGVTVYAFAITIGGRSMDCHELPVYDEQRVNGNAQGQEKYTPLSKVMTVFNCFGTFRPSAS
jgi:hypothetical protein